MQRLTVNHNLYVHFLSCDNGFDTIMKSTKRYNHLLFWATVVISITIIDGWKCQLYLWEDNDYGGSQYGPFDVGTWVPGSYPEDVISSLKLYSGGYSCYVSLYGGNCNSGLITSIGIGPNQFHPDSWLGGWSNDNVLSCVIMSAVATSSPTSAPSRATLPPTLPPTSSCSDYNNATSADGNNEMRQFDDQHITNIDNYFMNGTFVSEFDSSYAHDLIECVGSDCIIHCNQSASCLETQIDINVQNKTTLLLCHDAYSCPDASVKTQSASMANISVVCIGKYSCINMDIHLANISSFNLYCLQHGACWDVNVTIDSNNNDTRHNDGIITCVSLHSCDHLVIATNSNQSQLIMYEHSEDVILNNGA
eukprot:100565_1